MRNIDELNITAIDAHLPRQNRIYHFIVCEQPFTSVADTKLLALFSEFWKKQSYNVYIVYFNKTLTVATFTPYPRMKLIFIPSNRQKQPKYVFAWKALNLMGYPLTATIFYDESRARFDQNNLKNMSAWDGSDGLLARLIAERMNATLVVSVPQDGEEIGEQLPNGTFTGCFGALVYGEVDIGLNMRYYRLNQFEGKIEATYANGRDDICLLIPRRGKAANLDNIFRPFKKFAWLGIALSVPCFTIIYYLISISSGGMRQSFFYYFLQLFSYTIQQQ